MPTYEYECLGCGKHFEVFQKITDAALKNCSYCKGKLKRLISSGCGLIFKGSGFYATDYKRKNPCGRSTKDNKGSNPKDCSCEAKKSNGT